MSHPSVIYWPPSTGTGFINAIANTQTIGNGENFVLNSNAGVQGVYAFDKILRTVSINGSASLLGITFLISGIGAPVDSEGNPLQILGPITETIVGIASNIAVSLNVYTQINSITVISGGPTPPTQVGLGPSGITQYTFLNYNSYIGQANCTVQFINQSTLEATVYGSLNRPEFPNPEGFLEPFGIEAGVFIPAFNLNGPSTTNQFIGLSLPLTIIWLNVADTLSDSLYFTVLKQGIR